MNRPGGLTLVGWLAAIGGGLQVLGSLGLVGIGAFSIFIGSTGAVSVAVLRAYSFPMWTGILLMLLGVLGVVLGYGILQLRPWSWTLGMVLYGLNLLAGIALLILTGLGFTVVFVTVLSAGILGYLATPEVRAALGHQPSRRVSARTPHAV
jgi:hypothetical protein